ncbi:MAG: UPF0164 family protein [Spirochaetaceae bacterium]
MRRFAWATIIFLLSIGTASGIGWPDFMYEFADETGVAPPRNTGLTTFPTLLLPMGGEMEGMASAYTAVARDYGFFEANPAASSRLNQTQLAVGHNNLIADANMEGLVYTTRFEHFGMGAGMKFLHVPFTEYDRYGLQQSSIRYTETVAGLNVSYNFLHSFDFHGIAVGASLKSAYRRIPEVIAPGQSAASLMGDVGVLTRFNLAKFHESRRKNFSVGLVARNLGPPALDEPLPSQATAGLAYVPVRPLTLAFDYTYPFVLGTEDPPEPPGYAGGLMVQITDFLATQTGFQLRGGNPRFTLGSTVGFPAVTLQMNYTLDLATQVDRIDRFSIQAAFDLGDRGRGEQRDRVEDFYLSSLEAYADGDLEQTVRLARRALEIDPTFTPAARTLDSAERMLTLQRQMESIRLGEEDRHFDDDRTSEPEVQEEGGE